MRVRERVRESSGEFRRRIVSDVVFDIADVAIVVRSVDAVVDLDENGDVIGVEILGLIARHPGLTAYLDRPVDPATRRAFARSVAENGNGASRARVELMKVIVSME